MNPHTTVKIAAGLRSTCFIIIAIWLIKEGLGI
jgi:hypothetical protein